ncbi:integrase [Candidatus Woesearchaeota archaeon]|nr:integrase [Candidatus Woesearchaeota archaeon]|tara:strand:- start:32 stop:661 length:630 start_codon:yes stop_codon:yes gene_type:complete
MELLSLIIIFVAGIIASSFGTLTGGASLLTIPLLIFLGLPASVAIGTNRAGLLGQTIAGWYEFDKKHLINYKIGWSLAIPAVIGAIVGANLVLKIDESILEKIIVAFTLIILIFIIFEPDIGLKSKKQVIRKKEYLIGMALSFFLGIYGGFYGANMGTFFSYMLILLFGQNFIQSAATRKVASFLIAMVAFSIFAYNGVVIYTVACDVL